MKAARTWPGLAVVGSTLVLVAGMALVPSASLASTHACGNHTVTIELESEPGKPKTKFKLPVKQIVTQGVSCAAAYKFLGTLYGGKTTGKPEGYNCKIGKFKVPTGTVPEVCTKSGKKIQFAGRGG